MANLDLPEWINRRTVEDAYRMARVAQERGQQSFADRGYRAAKARDPRLLKALEGGATILQRMSEEQLGTHGLEVGGLYVNATEFTLWKNAYELADKGDPTRHYEWIYGSAAALCGYV